MEYVPIIDQFTLICGKLVGLSQIFPNLISTTITLCLKQPYVIVYNDQKIYQYSANYASNIFAFWLFTGLDLAVLSYF
jgi:hypothetical protein